MAAAGGKEGADAEKEPVESAVVFCSEHAAYAVLREATIESVGVVGRREIDVTAGARWLPLNSEENGVGVLEDGAVDGKESMWESEGPVVQERDSDLKRSITASLKSLVTPSENGGGLCRR